MTACERDGGITSVLLAYILASLSGVARWGGCVGEDDDEEEEEDVRISTSTKVVMRFVIDKPNERK